ncbi:hypothetical protein POM88_047897 [Heracleum sosnowskyi]|uniref:Uncharacterized protein n=1 Tax=Heracleum sosnowskyi TaxID=360622 RepID=A0AAD8GV84_9APIA|nr:hypothetical protein POM88_047897 [Heracleum sosnowskyi]
MNPPMYIDLLEAFWRTATCTIMAKEDGTSFIEIHCTVGGNELQFGEKEVNETFGFKTEDHDAEANDKQMVDFMDFIKYADTIEMAKLNKRNVRREWSYLFDALQKVFLCRKTGWDQISHIAVKLAYSLAYNQEINVGAIITRELAQRLGKTPRGRGQNSLLICMPVYLNSKPFGATPRQSGKPVVHSQYANSKPIPTVQIF